MPGLILEIIAAVGAMASLAFYGISIAGALRFLRTKHKEAETLPGVSLLKPLKGIDPGAYNNFRSHCLQGYPEFEVIFGVSEANDPCVVLIEKLQKEFPQRSIQVVVCRQDLGANTKVSNLAQMLKRARYDHLLINDGDIRVPPDYLKRVIAPLADPMTGLVTCLYRGVPERTLGSRLEALSISTDFCAGVLSAQLVEGGIHFGLGSTLAFRRKDLEAIGGFEALSDYLADDYEIGNRIAGLGRKVVLCDAVVETLLPAYSLGEFLKHQLRWARTIRDSRRWGYAGLALTFGIPWALLALLAARGALWAWELLLLATCGRIAAAAIVGRVALKDPEVLRALWLIPIRDLLAVMIWAGGFVGKTVIWRGKHYRLMKGRLTRIDAS